MVKITAASVKMMLSETVAELKRTLRRDLPEIGSRIAKPEKFESFADGATRTGQIMAALMLGPLIVVNLVIIRVISGIIESVFGGISLGVTQTPIFAWLFTAVILGILIFSAWVWFQWVRTSGFGVFE